MYLILVRMQGNIGKSSRKEKSFTVKFKFTFFFFFKGSQNLALRLQLRVLSKVLQTSFPTTYLHSGKGKIPSSYTNSFL